MANQRNKLAALTECGFNGIPVKNWWTQFLLKSIREDSIDQIYHTLWFGVMPTAGNITRHFQGRKVQRILLSFEQDSFTIFEKRPS